MTWRGGGGGSVDMEGIVGSVWFWVGETSGGMAGAGWEAMFWSIMLLKRLSGLGMFAVSGVGVGWASFRIAISSTQIVVSSIDSFYSFILNSFTSIDCRGIYVQATLKLETGSVYFVLFGSGEAGKLGTSCVGCGVDSSAIVCAHCLLMLEGSEARVQLAFFGARLHFTRVRSVRGGMRCSAEVASSAAILRTAWWSFLPCHVQHSQDT